MPDLTTIPGLTQLWAHTTGDPRIKIAVLDGQADMDRACFRGANFSQLHPYWQEDPEPIPPGAVEQYWELEALQKKLADLKKGEDETAAKDAEIQALEAEIDTLKETIPAPIRNRLGYSFHATHISSTIFGQPNSPVEGMAPRCTGINIPITISGEEGEFISPLNLAHAFNLALEQGANIIHCAACHPTQTGLAHEMLTRVVRQCQDNNILIVAPGGNDKGECWCVPAVLPNVLTVGAMRDDGQPFKFSNWGGKYQEQGVLAPGENILGAVPGTDEPARKKGTSCAAPIITGVAALLMSRQLQQGEKPNAEAVRAAILQSAIPCDPAEVAEPERCLLGKLNIPGAFQLLSGEPITAVAPSSSPAVQFASPQTVGKQESEGDYSSLATTYDYTSSEVRVGELGEAITPTLLPQPLATLTASTALATHPADAAAVTPSLPSNRVYALGTIGYDFGTEARRDSFKQLMPAVEIDGTAVPANPYDARQMIDYLEQNPSEARALIWTLNLDLTPIYAIEPVGEFGDDVYETLQQMLAGQILAEDSEDYIERVSIPGLLADKTVTLFSGQEVPVIKTLNTRGMYGWKVNTLVDAALATVQTEAGAGDERDMRNSLISFLNRVYYDLRNLGKTARDRALNFAATNTFQAASTFAQAVARGMQLDSIEVEKSPFCRIDSDCWDVKLKFFDPENSERAKKVFRFTVDVIDTVPVTLGDVKTWSVPY